MDVRIDAIRFYLDSPAGGRDISVRRIEYSEEINHPYLLRVECDLPDLRREPIQQVCDTLAGASAVLRMVREYEQPLEERVCGVILTAERMQSRFERELERQESRETGSEPMDAGYVLHIVPAFELLKLHTWGSGSWHDRTHADVLEMTLSKELEKYGRKVVNKAKSGMKVDHIVRPPGESLLDFARRLMNDAGISSYFTHEGDAETLVLCDTNDGYIEGTQYQPRDQPFRVDYTQRHHQTELVARVKGQSTVQPSSFQVQSFDAVGTPPVPILGNSECDGKSQAEYRVWGGMRPTELGDPDKQHEEAAKMLRDRKMTYRNSVVAKTTMIGMRPGRTFMLELTPGDVRPFVVQTVKASGEGGDTRNIQDYVNEAIMVPLATKQGQQVQVRADDEVLTGTMPGLTLAELIAIESHPIESDRLLRCRLRFLWDQQEGETATTYVSVLQNMAGLFGGSQWIPREGDRVVVAFHEGRPDRGVILGAVYDEQFRPPYMGPPDRSSVLPESSLWLGWNHSSVEPGKPASQQGALDRHSMLCMDVTAQQEMFYFGAPYDWRRDVGHDSIANVENDQTVAIGRNKVQTIKGTFEETIDGVHTQIAKSDHNVSVGANHNLTVSGNSVINGHQHRTENYAGAYAISVKQGMVENIDGDRRVKSGQNYNITVANSFTVLAQSIALKEHSGGGGSSSGSGGGGTGVTLSGDAVVQSTQSVKLLSANGGMEAGPQGVATKGRSVQTTDEGGGSIRMENGSLVIDAPRGMTIRCGGSEFTVSPEGIVLNGERLAVASQDAEFEAQRVNFRGK